MLMRLLEISLFAWGAYQIVSGLIRLRQCNRDLRSIDRLERRLGIKPQVAMIFTAENTFTGRLDAPVITGETARVEMSRDGMARALRTKRARKLIKLSD